MHGFGFTCPPGGYYCLVLNKYLERPLTCLNCLGWLGITTGFNNLKKTIELGKKADAITVDCKFMQEFYHAYSPSLLPLPMETDILKPSEKKDNYILYMGRLSFEKNPYGFLEIVKQVKHPCKMILYEIHQDIVGLKSNYIELLSTKLPNLEIILNPTKEEMIELIKHAKFVVLPYLFAEPFGVAAANTVMCGTPLITFPFGNSRNMTHLLPNTLSEMIELINMTEHQYYTELSKTLEKGNELKHIHNPVNAIKIWDVFYKQLYSNDMTKSITHIHKERKFQRGL